MKDKFFDSIAVVGYSAIILLTYVLASECFQNLAKLDAMLRQ